MELDILNEIVSSTVGDLFRFQSKYNILAVALPKASSTVPAVGNGIKTLVLKQQQQQQIQQQPQQQLTQNNTPQIANRQNQPSQLQSVQSSSSVANSKNLRQPLTQQKSNIVQVEGNINTNSKTSFLDNKKPLVSSVSSSLNSSLANAQLLDQSNISQLNISKDTIAVKGSVSSLNASFQDPRNTERLVSSQDGFLRDSANIIVPSSTVPLSNPFGYLIQGSQNQQPLQQQQLISNKTSQINSNSQKVQQQYQQYFQQNPLQIQQNNPTGHQLQPLQAALAPTVLSSFPVQSSSSSHAILNNFIKETNLQQKQQTFPKYSENEWIQIEAPKKLEESMQRLQLDSHKISMRVIKEMNFKQLQLEKKRVKNELKLYDQAFEDYFHTQPQRDQKEPMRPLYVYYKGLKQALSKLPINNENERPTNGTKQTQENTFLLGQGNQKNYQDINTTISTVNQSAQSSMAIGMSSHQTSYGDNNNASNNSEVPAGAIGGAGGKQYLRQSQPLLQLQQNQQQQVQRGSTAVGSERTEVMKNNNPNRFLPQNIGQTQNLLGNQDIRGANNFNNLPSNQHQIHQQQQQAYSQQQQQQSQNQQVLVQAVVIEQKIAAMKKKRGILRDQLQVYQDEFYRTHNRKIKYHKDVLLVEREYKEYKELKKEILKLEEQQNQFVPGNNNTNKLTKNSSSSNNMNQFGLLDNSYNDQNQYAFEM